MRLQNDIQESCFVSHMSVFPLSTKFVRVPEEMWVTQEERENGNRRLRCGLCEIMDYKARITTEGERKVSGQLRYDKVSFYGKSFRPGNCCTFLASQLPKDRGVINPDFPLKPIVGSREGEISPLVGVGRINYITQRKGEYYMNVSIFARPEELVPKGEYREDVNRLHWLGHTIDIYLNVDEYTNMEFCNIQDNIKVFYIPSNDYEKISALANCVISFENFYFSDTYNPNTRKLEEPTEDIVVMFDRYPRIAMDEAIPNMEPMPGLELYAGMGGTSIGMTASDAVECTVAVELDDAAQKSFKASHKGDVHMYDDVTGLLRQMRDGTLSSKQRQYLKKCKVVQGGTPCQGFSNLNWYTNTRETHAKSTNSIKNCEQVMAFTSLYHELGTEDYTVMENVTGMLREHLSEYPIGKMRSDILSGRQTSVELVNAAHFGSPQHRTRVVCFTSKMHLVHPSRPSPKFASKVNKKDGSNAKNTHIIGQDGLKGPLQDDSVRSISALYSPQTYAHATYDLPADAQTCRKGVEPPKGTVKITTRDTTWYIRFINQMTGKPTGPRILHNHVSEFITLKQWEDIKSNLRRSPKEKEKKKFRDHRANPHKPVATVTSMGVLLHPTANRRSTTLELARLQSIPDHATANLCGTLREQHQQVANAVPPMTLAMALGASLHQAAAASKLRNGS
eukprot:comp23706_c0_seq2/m.40765 comp23706_c0_seq2/g.40765  ORF comp23706_c0_seq2/g.40765 comp23706_c0_seq2/m.40765 type:complete len:678 (-) comp23706_c0_seq2:138-2171(-)